MSQQCRADEEKNAQWECETIGKFEECGKTIKSLQNLKLLSKYRRRAKPEILNKLQSEAAAQGRKKKCGWLFRI